MSTELDGKKVVVEKEWVTKHGMLAFVVWDSDMGFRCGYVGITKNHPLYEVNYEKLPFQCHGGLTFSGFHGLGKDGYWWVGFDCHHYDDIALSENPILRKFTSVAPTGATHKTLEFCENECEILAEQIVTQSSVSYYFKFLKNGLLEENEHNHMLALSLENEDDEYVCRYFEQLKEKSK